MQTQRIGGALPLELQVGRSFKYITFNQLKCFKRLKGFKQLKKMNNMEAGTREDELLKITRGILIERSGSCLVIKPDLTVYLRAPNELVETFQEKYGIDMRKDKKRMFVNCQLVEEKEEDGDIEAAFLFKITKMRGDI